jgi:2,4-dienoyl-CoA reductase-like NADH-dependent reductase (Old Yellow Enzyme family)
MLMTKQSDFIALGEIALCNQDWPNKVKNNRAIKAFDFALLAPIADLTSAKTYLKSSQ